MSQNGRRCRTRTAIHTPKAGVLPLHYILYMVEPAGIEPASEIPTWTRPSYAIDDFSALLFSGRLRYRQICPRAHNGLHTSTTLSLLAVTRKTAHLDVSLPHTFTRPVGMSFWNPTVNQAATLSATKAAKAGWIITTVSELSFHFLYAFRRSSTCESCTLKTPSNPLRPHMKLSKCLCVVGAERIELPT